MRVLMLVGRSTGGIGTHVDRLVDDLRREGTDVALVTDPSTAACFGWADAHLLWPVHPGLRAPRGLVDWHRIMRLTGTVDIVHAHGHQAAVIAAVAVLRARPRPRLVVTLHNDLPPRLRSGPAARVVAWALRRADLVTGASGDLVELARDLGAEPVELATVASPGVAAILASSPATPGERAALRTAAGLAPDGPLVVTVSRLAPQKDLHTLAAAARDSRCGATWVVIGAGDDALRAHVEREASGIPLVFLGARDDVPAWLRAADVFVLTSRWEARALVVQEAMAAGVPVVVTRTGGLPDLVGDAGVLVPVGDAAAVTRAVDSLLGDPDERRRLGARARERALAWASPGDEARRWRERYTETLRR
ncbi:glycosyltransferase [Intrasporangium oryzae NRRL B-24470]|uniref:D-inositol 3-phosphate glycosyltransferase n=1 Tax=Intrasporangium oryzae NRRL B-24470 TaxID=1386089 RepID=W9GGI1_9MICO|nr:glycosyltransferase family 4 protein [Intrasporangium oryzae]EWT02974.1 glycosyltransferase [Intrasporangium oryzae NRRL B-24470]